MDGQIPQLEPNQVTLATDKTIEDVNKIYCNSTGNGAVVDVKAYPVKGENVWKVESQLLNTLKAHNGILNIVGMVQNDAKPFPYMMLRDPSPKGNLRGAIEKNKFSNNKESDWQRIIWVAIEIAKPIKYAHSEKVGHGNLSPQNILFNSAWLPRISDFKIPQLNQPIPEGLNFKVTPYMAPELVIALDSQDKSFQYTAAGDVYSFGCIVYELVTGKPPFGPDANITESVKNRNLPFLDSIPENIPGAFRSLILGCCAMDPSKRFDFDYLMEFLRNATTQFLPKVQNSILPEATPTNASPSTSPQPSPKMEVPSLPAPPVEIAPTPPVPPVVVPDSVTEPTETPTETQQVPPQAVPDLAAQLAVELEKAMKLSPTGALTPEAINAAAMAAAEAVKKGNTPTLSKEPSQVDAKSEPILEPPQESLPVSTPSQSAIQSAPVPAVEAKPEPTPGAIDQNQALAAAVAAAAAAVVKAALEPKNPPLSPHAQIPIALEPKPEVKEPVKPYFETPKPADPPPIVDPPVSAAPKPTPVAPSKPEFRAQSNYTKYEQQEMTIYTGDILGVDKFERYICWGVNKRSNVQGSFPITVLLDPITLAPTQDQASTLRPKMPPRPLPRSIIVVRPTPGGPAATQTQIEAFDLIDRVDGLKFDKAEDLLKYVRDLPEGTTVRLAVRKQKESGKLVEYTCRTALASPAKPTAGCTIGIEPKNLHHWMEIVSVQPGTPAANAKAYEIGTGGKAPILGLQPGDVVESINHRPLFTAEVSVLRWLSENNRAEGKDVTTFLINRGGRLFQVLVQGWAPGTSMGFTFKKREGGAPMAPPREPTPPPVQAPPVQPSQVYQQPPPQPVYQPAPPQPYQPAPQPVQQYTPAPVARPPPPKPVQPSPKPQNLMPSPAMYNRQTMQTDPRLFQLKGKKVKVVASYNPEQSDELQLIPGQIIEVMNVGADMWGEGRNIQTGKAGMFPMNCVRPVQ